MNVSAVKKKKQRAVSRTILSIVGVVGGLFIMANCAGAGTAGQWGGIICVGAMIAGLVWLHKQNVGD